MGPGGRGSQRRRLSALGKELGSGQWAVSEWVLNLGLPQDPRTPLAVAVLPQSLKQRRQTVPSPPFTYRQLATMSQRAQERIAALGQQLQSGTSASDSQMPRIARVAGSSKGLRADGKVVIITGT